MAVLHLPRLADEITDLRDRRILAANRARVRDRERGSAAEAGADAAQGERAGQDHDDVGTEALDLLAHRLAGAVADGDHNDERGNADEHPEHGERRAHLVAPDRLSRGGEDHEREGEKAAGRQRQARRFGGLEERRALRLGGGGRRSAYPFVGDDDAVAHGDDAVGIGGNVGLVGDENDGDALLAIERAQRFHDLVRSSRIEIAGGLIGKQKARRIDQGAGDGDALLLAAGELAGRIAFAVAETEQLQRGARPFGAYGATLRPRGGVVERQTDILKRASASQQVEALEHEAEALAADTGEIRLAQCRDIDAFHEVMTAGRLVEAAENVHQRRFARAGRAHDGDELAGLDGEADAAERFNLDIADNERAGDILYLDHRRRAGTFARHRGTRLIDAAAD